MNNYTVYHLHSDLSNGTTTLDSVTKFKSYVDRAKELGMTAMAFSEHGNIFEWLHKKEYIEKSGMKYIHGVEAYITETLDEKIRDNYHVGLYAKNKEGFKEINRMMSASKAFNREDNHFFYQPRILFDDLLNTSDNVIVTTACLGGILNHGDNIKNRFIDFLTSNKHRCFLEIQHHNVNDQVEFNKYLYNLHLENDIPLIAGTDTHALNKDELVGREILQARKDIHFDNEDGWDLSFKSYDELVSAYENQNSLPKDVWMQAIENTNVFANMVEEFELDRSFKYPELYDNPEEVFQQKIKEGYYARGIDKKENVDEYNKRIQHEINVYRDQKAINFMLLEETYKSALAKEGIYPGYSRGSVSGSLVAYLLNITDVDSVKYDLYFERFMNPERVSLADVDSDWSPYDRGRVKEYLHKDIKQINGNLKTAEIITFNTIALKGAFKDVTGGIRNLDEKGKLDSINFPRREIITLEQANNMSKDIESKETEYRGKYPETFKYVDMLMGTIVSLGSHPAATIVSPIDLDENVGTFTLTTNEYPITQLNMKEIDSLNYLKLDVLGLDNVGIINETCKLAGIDRLTPDNMDFTDEKVWENMRKSPVSIFQFESAYSHGILKQILSDETIAKIKSKHPNVNKIELMSVANGAIRPAGDSYRDALVNGEFKDNGHEVLNEFLAPTNGFLVFQESIMGFLNEFCGYTYGQADMIRRGFAKILAL